MTDRIAESSPRGLARLGGLLYLIEMAGNGFALFTLSRLIVRDDAAATAHNILASEPLYRLGVAADLVGIAAYVGVTAILYVLLKPMNRTLSLLAAFFSLAGCATWAIASVANLAPLVLLAHAPYLTAFTTAQLQALAYTSLRLHTYGADIAMAFFGVYCLSIGSLILRSDFLPRILGPLLTIAGLGYLANSFAVFLSLPFAANLSTFALLPGIVAEGLLALWLVLAGVNAAKWKEQAAASGA